MEPTGRTFLRWRNAIAALAVAGFALATLGYCQTQTVTLVVQQTPAEGGTITPTLGVHYLPLNSQVVLIAVPNPGYRFAYWLGDVSDPIASTTTVYLDAPKIVVAVFVEITDEELVPAEPAAPSVGGGFGRGGLVRSIPALFRGGLGIGGGGLVPEWPYFYAYPTLTTSPPDGSELDFGYVRVGTGRGELIGVSNTGYADSLLYGAFSSAGGDFGPSTTQGFGPLIQGESDYRAYFYTPGERGSDQMDIVIVSTGGDSTITLSGLGVGPVFYSDPPPGSMLDFGDVLQGDVETLSLSVSNITDDPDGADASLLDLTLLSVTITGPDESLFSALDFAPGTVLSKGEEPLELSILFNASGPLGSKYATLTIQTDELTFFGEPGRSSIFDLTGNIVPEPGTVLLLSLGSVAFLKKRRA